MNMTLKFSNFTKLVLATLFVFAQSSWASPEQEFQYQEFQYIEKVKGIEKRFQEAIKQTSPVYFDAQRKLLKETFDLYAESMQLAMNSENGHLISSVVKLSDMLVDNDSTDLTAERLYQLYVKKKLLTTRAIDGLEASSAKKLKDVIKVRELVHKIWADNAEKAK